MGASYLWKLQVPRACFFFFFSGWSQLTRRSQYHFPSEAPPADDPIRTELAELGARLVEAKGQTRDKGKNKSYHLKAIAVVQCPWQEVLYVDSDSIPTRDPSYMFDAPNYKRLGVWATPDYWKTSANNPIWAIMGVKCRNEWEMETGQMFVDKKRHLDVFLLVQYMLENHHFVSVLSFFFFFLDDEKSTARAEQLIRLKNSGLHFPTATRISSAGLCLHFENDGPSLAAGWALRLFLQVQLRANSARTPCSNMIHGASRSLCIITFSNKYPLVLAGDTRGAGQSSCRCSTLGLPPPPRRGWTNRRGNRKMRIRGGWGMWIVICWRMQGRMGEREAKQRRW